MQSYNNPADIASAKSEILRAGIVYGRVGEENNAEFAENKSDIADDITDEPKSNRAQVKSNRAEIKSNRAENVGLCAIKFHEIAVDFHEHADKSCEIVIDFHEHAFLVCRHGFAIYPHAFLRCFLGVCGAADRLGMYEGNFLLSGDKKSPARASQRGPEGISSCMFKLKLCVCVIYSFSVVLLSVFPFCRLSSAPVCAACADAC